VLPGNPVATGLGADQYRPGSFGVPVGTFGGPDAGSSTERGPFGGRGGVVERGPGGARGAVPGGGPVGESERAGTRAVNGMGPADGRTESDEDKEHTTAEYLVSSHDSFWDDTPPVAPSVIGADEDDD
jgi:hypothetical protein